MSEAPQRRARATDVARAAGVSTATVDRVLNRRAGVRDVTVQRVLEAAARLAYLPEDGPFAALAAKPLRLTFLLPAGTNRYLRMLGETVGYMEDQLAPLNVRCRAHTIEGFDPRVLAERLLHHGRRSDGVALMPLEHPLVREAVHTLAEEGVPVVTLVSDLSNSRRAGYVGLDNRAAGRTAALLLGRFIGARAATVGLINRLPAFLPELIRIPLNPPPPLNSETHPPRPIPGWNCLTPRVSVWRCCLKDRWLPMN